MALSGLDVANIAKRVGFSGNGLIMAIAISKRESGWNPEAWNGNLETGDQSVGLMQINMLGQMGVERMKTLQGMGYDVNTVQEAIQLLKNPEVNMRFAYAMSNSGQDFYHWGGYKGMADNYNTNMSEAQQLASQATGAPVEYTGGTGMADPAGSAEYQQALATLKAMQADPRNSPSHEDFAEWQTYIAEQARIVAALEPRASSSTDPLSRDPNDVLNTDFQNKLQELQLGLSFDQTNLSRAIADLDRFLGLKEDSRARTAAIAEGQDLIRRWGTKPGKSSFSLADLGSGFAAAGRTSGLNPNENFINYTGTIRIDPEADMRRFDAASGVSGQAPGIPSLITDPSQFPNSPTLDQSTYYGQPAGANPYYDGGGGGTGVEQTQTATLPGAVPTTSGITYPQGQLIPRSDRQHVSTAPPTTSGIQYPQNILMPQTNPYYVGPQNVPGGIP